MSKEKPVHMLCLYRVKNGCEDKFIEMLKLHWPTLSKMGLVTADRAQVQRGRSKDGKCTFIETFAWKDASSPGVAHQTPEVMKVWEPMGALTEGMEFLAVEPVKL